MDREITVLVVKWEGKDGPYFAPKPQPKNDGPPILPASELLTVSMFNPRRVAVLVLR